MRENLEPLLKQFYFYGTEDFDINIYIDKFFEEEIKVEEKTIPVTYFLIKNSCGWNRFCDVTGNDHYAINEWGDFNLDQIFWLTPSQYKELNF